MCKVCAGGRLKCSERTVHFTSEKSIQNIVILFLKTRLRQLLISEEEAYEKEFKEVVKNKVEEDIHIREKRLMMSKNEREQHRIEFVKKKQMQQLL